MITNVSPTKRQKIQEWNRTYFLFPTTIWIEDVAYRIFKDWVWRKGHYYYDMVGGDSLEWEFSLTNPKYKLNKSNEEE